MNRTKIWNNDHSTDKSLNIVIPISPPQTKASDSIPHETTVLQDTNPIKQPFTILHYGYAKYLWYKISNLCKSILDISIFDIYNYCGNYGKFMPIRASVLSASYLVKLRRIFS